MPIEKSELLCLLLFITTNFFPSGYIYLHTSEMCMERRKKGDAFDRADKMRVCIMNGNLCLYKRAIFFIKMIYWMDITICGATKSR
jgi:hypothetical protein